MAITYFAKPSQEFCNDWYRRAKAHWLEEMGDVDPRHFDIICAVFSHAVQAVFDAHGERQQKELDNGHLL